MRETAALVRAAGQIRRPMPGTELLSRSEYARLRARVQSMPVIEQAKGILMARSGCGPEAAFDLLRRAPQRSNVPGQGTGGSDGRPDGKRVPGRGPAGPPGQLRFAAPSGLAFSLGLAVTPTGFTAPEAVGRRRLQLRG